MKKIKYIDFGTEGCTIIRFELSDFAKFELFDVVSRYEYDEQSGEMVEDSFASKGMFCIIKKSANQKTKWRDYHGVEIWRFMPKPFNHFRAHPDIVYVGFAFEDDTYKCVDVPFEGVDEHWYDSKLQRCARTETGDMIIEIRESEEKKSIFDEITKDYHFDDENDPELDEIEEQSMEHQLAERFKNKKDEVIII